MNKQILVGGGVTNPERKDQPCMEGWGWSRTLPSAPTQAVTTPGHPKSLSQGLRGTGAPQHHPSCTLGTLYLQLHDLLHDDTVLLRVHAESLCGYWAGDGCWPVNRAWRAARGLPLLPGSQQQPKGRGEWLSPAGSS